MTDRQVTPELLARYNRPGPRYTSYPTAPQFIEDYDSAAYAASLKSAGKREDDPFSLYVHIPFCDHRCLYCGCHVVITKRDDVVGKYLDHMKREIELVANALGNRKGVLQLHFGGGTPTHLTPMQLEELFSTITDNFTLLPDAEVAVEIDPRVTTVEHIGVLRRLGFNRLSLGVQDLDPEVQKAVERNQTLEQTVFLLEEAKKVGFTDFNLDLIYGLPLQTEARFRHTLEQIIDLKPNRVAVYSYANVPWMRPHQKKIDPATLPNADEKFALFASAINAFTRSGYVQIGMDHFALPEDELAIARKSGTLTRNFMGYTIKAAPDMIAFGISGIGEVDGSFAQNAKKISDYYRLLDESRFPVERGYTLNTDDRIRREVILSLMCNFELSISALERNFDITFTEYFAGEIKAMKEDIDGEFFRLTPEKLSVLSWGQLFIRNICMIFDPYLRSETKDGKPIYSRTV